MLKCENCMLWFYGIMSWTCSGAGGTLTSWSLCGWPKKQSDCGSWSAGSYYPRIKSPLSHNLFSRLVFFFSVFYNYAQFIIWKFQNNQRGGSWWAGADRAKMAVVRLDSNLSSNLREIKIFFNFFSTYFISTQSIWSLDNTFDMAAP